jgi:hypothetical protein
MRFCQPHWDQLRDAIAKRGLAHLVARHGAELVERLERQSEDGVVTKDTYDPLMDAHNMIVARVFERAPHILTGDFCPVCEAITGLARWQAASRERVEDHFINGPANAVLRYCEDQGFVEKREA